MIRRLFIAINLPTPIRESIKEKLEGDKESGADLYRIAEMIPEENWHITVKFLGDQEAKHVNEIKRAIRDAMKDIVAPEVSMRTITTAPPNRPPRMIWAATTTESNHALASIKEAIERELTTHGISGKGEVFPDYRGHITLAELPKGHKIAERMIALPSSLTFKPITIDLIEAHRDRTVGKFSVVTSFSFKHLA
jgi:2'-5' RNA ligase